MGPAATAADSQNRRRVPISQSSTTHRRHRCRRVRWVDRARVRPARRPRDAHRRLGAWPCARQLRRGDAHHPRHLRDARGLHQDGDPSPGAVASVRPRAPTAARDRRAVDVRRRRQLRPRVGAACSATTEPGSTSLALAEAHDAIPRSISTASARCSSSRRPDIFSRGGRARTWRERVVAEGGEYRLGAAVSPVAVDGAAAGALPLEDGTLVEADAFVFACGPWLATLFPDVVGASVSATRQEVFYFGTPAGDARFTAPALPVWMDFAVGSRSGRLRNSRPLVRPDSKSQTMRRGRGSIQRAANGSVSADGIARARAFLSRRFPALADAPLVGSEVCQVQKHAGRPFHRRSPPTRVERVDCWRRLGSWL